MYNLFKLNKLMYLFLLIALVVSCKNGEEDIFGNYASITGKVYFNNTLTNQKEVADKAQVSLSRNENSPAYSIQTNSDGTFRINYLRGGNYKLIITSTQSYSSANGLKTISYNNNASEIDDLKKREEKDLNDITLDLNLKLSNPPLLRIKLVDPSNYALAGFKVCLYSTGDFAKVNENCEGSIQTGISNERGYVLFADLEEKSYVVKSVGVLGSTKIGTQPEGNGTPALTKNELNTFVLNTKVL